MEMAIEMRVLKISVDEGDALQPTLLVAETSDQLRALLLEPLRAGHTIILGDIGYELVGKRKFKYEHVYKKEQTKEQVESFPWDTGEIGIEVKA